ncbi:MAG: sensor histidine kinase [Candidatus Dormibacteria bacterium]
MKDVTAFLQHISSFGFGLVGLLAVISWLRTRDRGNLYLALALGLLGAVALDGELTRDTGFKSPVLSVVSLGGFMGCGYALLLFRNYLVPLHRRVLIGVGVAMALVIGGLAPLTLNPAPPGALPSGPALIATIILILVWAGSVGEPVYRMWQLSRTRPAVQRARLRALAAGYGVIILVLLVAIGAVGAGRGKPLGPLPALLVEFGVVAAIPILYASFAPPQWLRRSWRASEERAFSEALQQQLLGLPDIRVLADHALTWAIRLVGAEGGVVLDADGATLAARSIDEHLVTEVSTAPQPGPEGVPHRLPDGNSVISVPLTLGSGTGRMVVVAGRLTPAFGGEEGARLSQYAVAVAATMERMRLAEALRRSEAVALEEATLYRSLMQNVSDLDEGFVSVNAVGRVTYANDAYCRLTGYTVAELRALDSFMALIDPAEQQALRERVVLAEAHQPTLDRGESIQVRKDGRRVPVEFARKRLELAGGGQTVAIVRDATEKKRLLESLRQREASLLALTRELEERVHDRTAELELSNRDLQASNRELDAFSYSVAHDLRAPLRAIGGFARIVTDEKASNLDDETKGYLADIATNAEEMGDLINDLLELSRLGRQKLSLQPIDPGDVARRVLEKLAPDMAGRTIEVEVGEMPGCETDPTVLQLVYQNLLANAIKFSRTRPVAHIEVGALPAETPPVYFVRDDGAGFDMAYKEQLFNVFQRLHPRAEYEGTGVGLAIVQRIVARHGGRAWAEGEPGAGATFYFTLQGGASDEPR